jgi:hypothetical protein
MAFKLVPAEQVISGQFLGQYELAGDYFQSPDFVSGEAGWALFGDGSAQFNNVTARGSVTATEFDGTDFEINSAGIFMYNEPI